MTAPKKPAPKAAPFLPHTFSFDHATVSFVVPEATAIVLGSVVRLKSGGQEMTVTRKDGSRCECVSSRPGYDFDTLVAPVDALTFLRSK